MIKNKTHKLIITATVAATLCVVGSAYYLTSASNTFKNKISASSSKAEVITEAKAKKIALNKAGNGYTVITIELDSDDRIPNYDIEISNGTYEIDAEINASTGEILKWEKELDDDAKKTAKSDSNNAESKDKSSSQKVVTEVKTEVISNDKAKKIALNKAGSDYRITDIELDKEDGSLVYELELKNGSYEIEAEIDAYTGQVLKWEKELDD